MKMIFLVDGDNNIGTGLKGIELLSDQDSVLVFYQKTGLALSKIQKLCAGTSADVQYVESIRGGKNSIDFQIITELGVLVGKREADYAYVISQDKGYSASIDALRARYADAFQEVALRASIEDCLHLSFVRQSANRRELCNALVKEYGAAQGEALYNHMKAIFQSPEVVEVTVEAEKSAVKPTRSRRNARRKKAPTAVKLSE
ncbi:PIN domain-containing protein [Oscillibacter sp.]|uniref:PIN domain-containing protein n=1 Tax=Oscillibacter sp. TaxID=1945593 RepID=UPI002613B7E6|nr:PIN domain-containing protein [Oscillibacter sp.]MDD3347591.1 PIN domain-containing protein [Oscillibacter sp.]